MHKGWHCFFGLLLLSWSIPGSLLAQLPYSACNCGNNIDPRYFRIEHYHRIKDHPLFGEKQLINQICGTAENRDTLRVVADGTASSIFEIHAENNNCSPLPVALEIVDEDLVPVDTTLTKNYGQLILWAKYPGFALYKYQHPRKVPEPGMKSGFFYINFKNNSNDGIYTSMTIEYFRPPVVMVHGLWSAATAFGDMEAQLIGSGEYTPDQLFIADYKTTNDRAFSVNGAVVPDAINHLISTSRNAKIATGTVDIVCHSMGGILTRNYLNSPSYTIRNDIRRVITCNTPHAGSQMANWLLDPSQYGTTVAGLLGQQHMNCYGGAVSDLRVGMPVINGVAYGGINGDAEVHAVKTTENVFYNIFSTVPIIAPSGILIPALIGGVCGTFFLEDVFDSPYHDFIVAQESQEGGLAGNFTSLIQNQQHVGSVANGNVMNRVAELLNETFTGPSFTNAYSGFTLSYNVNVPCLPFTDTAILARGSTPDVDITAPVSGTNFPSGTTMNITYTAAMCDTVLCILRIDADSFLLLANSGSAGSMSLPIPASLYGRQTLMLVGVDPANKIVDVDTVHLQFTTSATLDSISIYPESFYFNQQDTAEFMVHGHYSDGVIRDLTDDPTLTFEFFQGNASRYNIHYVRLDSLEGDSLIVSKGNIESDTLVISKIGTNYASNCHIVSNLLNTGPGSFREALACVSENDTLFFSPAVEGDTIVLDDSDVFIEKSVYIINQNVQPVVIRGGANEVLLIAAEANVALKNIHLESDHPSHICINNFGQLTIEQVDCFTTGQEKAVIQNLLNGTLEVKGQNSIR